MTAQTLRPTEHLIPFVTLTVVRVLGTCAVYAACFASSASLSR